MNKKVKILIILLILVMIILAFLCIYFNNVLEKSTDSSVAQLVSDTQTIEGEKLSSSIADESVIQTEGNGYLDLKDTVITKEGDTSSLRNSDAQGLNSAVLANEGTEMNIESITVTTNGSGSSAVSAYGEGATITIADSTLITEGERSRGLVATGGATIIGTNMIIETSGYKSSGIATDTGGGTVTLSDSEITTNGEDSAGIYSTGTIYVTNTQVTTLSAESIVIDGYNLADIDNCEIESYSKRGALLLYTGPAERQKTTAMLNIKNSTFTIHEGPVFYVTNTNAEIYLENTEIISEGDILLEVGVDKYGELGQEQPVENPTGGDVILTAQDQTLEGDITADSESSVNLILNNSTYTGCVNNENSAERIVIELDENSVWNLTGDCYIDELIQADGAVINYNGYNLYIDD